MDWYFLCEPQPLPGAVNMARDQYLLERIEEGDIKGAVLRVYRWSTPTLSLGYHQRWERSTVLDAIERHGFDLVRRWTGGRAVLHIGEITYSVVAPFADPFKKTVSHNYQLLARALKTFTDHLLLDVNLAGGNQSSEPHKGGERSTPCFASLSEAELKAGEKKLIGSSQKLGKKAFLQHGSIPVQDHTRELCEVTGSDLDMDARMVTLGGLFQKAGRQLPDFDGLASLLRLSFEQTFGMSFTNLDEPKLDRVRIQEIVDEQFGNKDWTFMR